MAKKNPIVRASADDLSAMRARGESRSDWIAAGQMPQAAVERFADEEDGPLPLHWESTVQLGVPASKQAVHIRLDRDVLDWFRAIGPGYQTRINAVLRAFMEARNFPGSGQI